MGLLQTLCLPMLQGIYKKIASLNITAPTGGDIGPSLGKPDTKLDPESRIESESPSSKSESFVEEGWLDRRDWDHMRAIEDDAFKKLLLHHIDANNKLSVGDCKILFRTDGGNRHAVGLTLPEKGSYVISVPACGTATFWTDSDAFNFRSEVYTMKYIRRNTEVPVPEIFGWDNTLNNPIRAPYIIMRKVEGYQLYRIFDNPNPMFDRLRLRVLQNLARTMAGLQHLRFDKMGMLHFEDDPDTEGAAAPVVDYFFEQDGRGGMKEIPAYSSVRKYLFDKAEISQQRGWDELDDGMKGERILLRYAYERIPSTLSEPFTLTHPDLDSQNIFVSATGEITGIIDWDDVRVVPSCIGYSVLPLFLRRDWTPSFSPTGSLQEMPWTVKKHRDTYSQAMMKATTANDDAKYTAKSYLYCAVVAAAEDWSEDRDYFIDRLFSEVPSLRSFEPEQFLGKLGNDEELWCEAKDMLDDEFDELFELPGDSGSEPSSEPTGESF